MEASFRDPSGRLYLLEGRVIRLVRSEGAADLRAFLDSEAVKTLESDGRIVRTRILQASEVPQGLRTGAAPDYGGEPEEAALALEHERIGFPSYPYEWAPEMLHAAGELTLEIAGQLHGEGLGLKDATPYNVLFRGPKPVFVDVLSVERRDPGDATWMAYAQFTRTFLLPLLLHERRGLPMAQTFLTRRDGVEPEEASRLLGPLGRWRPPAMGLAAIPALLGRKQKAARQEATYHRRPVEPEKAAFILKTQLSRLGKMLRGLSPQEATSNWSEYDVERPSYSEEEFQAKQEFMKQVLREHPAGQVLDVGSNTGHFSRMAARAGAQVVAVDTDPAVVGRLRRRAHREGLDVLPLVVDLTRPTPAVGWRNRECRSFLERASGAFDAVWMLAVIHHMLVTERIPLEEILSLAAGLTRDLAVIEFVGQEDPLFRRLLRGREELHRDHTVERFERVCQTSFTTLASKQVSPHRRIYLLRKVSGTGD